MLKDNIYSDFNFNLSLNYETGIDKVYDIDTINQSIKNILLTKKGEVPFNPLFGSEVFQLLFEKIDNFTIYKIKKEIIVALENFEPRIKIKDIFIEGIPDNQEYNVRIEYLIVYLNTIESTQFTLELSGV